MAAARSLSFHLIANFSMALAAVAGLPDIILYVSTLKGAFVFFTI